jgi:hypothetical protein
MAQQYKQHFEDAYAEQRFHFQARMTAGVNFEHMSREFRNECESGLALRIMISV